MLCLHQTFVDPFFNDICGISIVPSHPLPLQPDSTTLWVNNSPLGYADENMSDHEYDKDHITVHLSLFHLLLSILVLVPPGMSN